jgi:lipid A ethanolaminephosphotransferase
MGYKLQLNRSLFILIVSIFIVVLYNSPVLPIKMEVNAKLGSLGLLRFILSEYFLGVLVLSIFLWLFSFSKFLLRFWVYTFIILSSIFSYYVFSIKIFIEETIIGAIFEADKAEAESVISLGLFVWIFAMGFLPIWFIHKHIIFRIYIGNYFNKLKNIIKNIILPSSILFFMYISLGFLNPSMIEDNKIYMRVAKNSLAYYMPFNYVAGFYQYFVSMAETKDIVLEDISKKYPFSYYNNKFDNQPVNIILVIGESARADRQSLNGYFRETNPNLKKVENLISFPNVYSCGTLSRVSVNCILSYNNRVDFKFPLRETNLISAFNSMGFYTYFLSSQTMYDTGANYFYLAAKDAKVMKFANNIRSNIPFGEEILDEHLFPSLDLANLDKHQKKLIVVYLTGSHIPYYRRYPKNFDVFKGDPSIRDSDKNAQYDNTVLYTDYILSEIIKKFNNQNTFLYYVADHGESLGENGRYQHGASPYENAPKEQVNVVQFIWASDSMIKLMGSDYKNIINKKNNILSQDNVFHTLFDCFGITSEIVNKKLSLCKH